MLKIATLLSLLLFGQIAFIWSTFYCEIDFIFKHKLKYQNLNTFSDFIHECIKLAHVCDTATLWFDFC